MTYFLTGLLLLTTLGILHTYVFFPLLTLKGMKGAASSRESGVQACGSQNTDDRETATKKAAVTSKEESYWPDVVLLMAVHNEEQVIARKLETTLAQDYAGSLKIYIGCDNCSDQTWPILQDFMLRYPEQVFASENAARMGKPNTINRLYSAMIAPADDLILWLTDASVFPTTDCLTELVRPMLRTEDLVLVDAQLLHTGIMDSGISRSEDLYINRESLLKQAESQRYGYLIGPFGGCYCLRASYFSEVPSNFLVDDFFLCMAAYEKGGRGISAPAARAYEGVGQNLGGEFKRKVRIATGNWQNLMRFRALWWPVKGNLAYAFFSHKVLRWWTPLLALIFAVSLFLLGPWGGNYWATTAFYGLSGLVFLPSLLDFIFRALGWHWLPLRNWRYFIAMNLALLLGFFRYLKGVKSNVWQPSERH